MDEHCKIPECKQKATKTWALVPVCDDHHEAIKAETDRFYAGQSNGTEAAMRPIYFKIHRLIPWSKVNLKAGDRR